MRKYVIGIFVGFALSFAVGAHAEVINMIGKTIEGSFPIKIDGKQLENQAVVVEGSSYLPVRAIGDALGMEILFDANLGIELKQKGDVGLLAADRERDIRTLKLYDLRKQADELQKQIQELYKIIEPYERIGTFNGKVGYEKERDSVYVETKKKREDLTSQRDEIERQIREIHDQQKQITDQKMEQLRQQLNPK